MQLRGRCCNSADAFGIRGSRTEITDLNLMCNESQELSSLGRRPCKARGCSHRTGNWHFSRLYSSVLLHNSYSQCSESTDQQEEASETLTPHLFILINETSPIVGVMNVYMQASMLKMSQQSLLYDWDCLLSPINMARDMA